jgi:hypothetical protein
MTTRHTTDPARLSSREALQTLAALPVETRERVYDRRVQLSEAQAFARRTLGCGCMQCVRAWENFDAGGPLLLHGDAIERALAREIAGGAP